MTNESRKARRGEPVRTRYRSERVFRSGQEWFIATREGIDVGPYGSLEEARHEIVKLVAILSQIDNEAAAAVVIREFRERPRFDQFCVEPSAELVLNWR